MKPISMLRQLIELPIPWLAAIAWIILGSLAQRGLAIAWRSAGLNQFERSMEIVSELATLGNWQEPWESDPEWQRLEQRLNIDLVPLAVNHSQATAVDQQAVAWTQTPQGDWRASVTVPVPGRAELAVRGTKEFNDQTLIAHWWLWWLIGGCGLWGIQFSRRAIEQALAKRRTPPIVDISNDQGTPELGTDYALQVQQVSQKRLHTILDNLREGVLMVDADGRIALVNAALIEQLQLATVPLEDRSLIEGRSLVEAIRNPRVVELLEHVARTQQSGQQRIDLSSGKRTLAVTATPITSGENQGGALLTAVDISSTQQSELARREFIAGASHELKTPLAAIRAYTETLQVIGADDPAATHKFLGNILEQADRMNRLVSSMMQLARAESGEMKLKLERIDAAAAIRPSIEAAMGIAQPKGQTVHTQLPSQQLLVMADRDALQTIASNLLSNAIRYTPSGGRIDVSLSLEPTDARAGRLQSEPAAVCLRVTDTGIGIAEADQGRIFERFYRVQKDRALDSGGTGLGLSIVKQLTEVLGGSVAVISRPGEGTRFEIWLPAVGFTQSS